MYATRSAGAAAAAVPGWLSSRELASIEERARSLGGNYVNVATAMTLAHQDVPALLAEIRRLRERWEDCGDAAAD